MVTLRAVHKKVQMANSKLIKSLLVGTVGYMGIRHWLNWAESDKNFFNWQGPSAKGVQAGSARFDLPILYFRDDCFLAVFGANHEAVQAALPVNDLHPVTLPDGRAAIIVIAFNYLETSIGPYGEVGIGIPCTYGYQATPLVPLLLEGHTPGWGIFVLHLPVTTQTACDAGRGAWGYPKFVADMEFLKQPDCQQVRLSEGNRHIFTFAVEQQGIPLKDNRPLVTYTVHDHHLLKTTIPSRAVYQAGFLPGSGHLSLGDHPVAHQLREFDLSPTSIFTKNYLTRSGILPVGERVTKIEQSYTGYIGKEQANGRLTVQYQ